MSPNHPLASHAYLTQCSVLDAYGHLSVRHPHDPTRFFMSRSVAPGVISSVDDLIEYYVENAEPVNASAAKGYSERCIHSEIMKRFPGVNAVVHSHAPAVVPYTVNGVPLRAVYHMAGFLGCESPVFDASDHVLPNESHDLLIRTTRLGACLAACFGDHDRQPDHSIALMRGHGFTAQGQSIMDAVLRSIYTQQNATIQTTALLTHAAHFNSLTEGEAKDTAAMTMLTAERPWRMWLREVEASSLYVNRA
ncbi:hypothetical protein M409DRAFT_68509 [Zasmidium cellare ATCC 36951]|uniref:Class II aldolase/adducin N-terminal domain-containing protein n=1 Tax=Zasmidium cellare ATCC 36951 TaxID=1080233 RepID=A0A6A6CDW1_ZASCE|nr:uncharacterized protein M409DRAFT_68509 [Zasmidium cellare ATCC 36951]KAF2163616.1 hypothetical protein M409DRAFT_68509 [Zasmidium cellare ATCC 36951]